MTNKSFLVLMCVVWVFLMALMFKAMQNEEEKQCNGKAQFYVAFGKPYSCANWEQRND